MLTGPRESGGQDAELRGQHSPGRVGVGSPTWQSIMASSSFSSIFFSPVSAHRRASRTGPSGRPPSFFSGASQSGDKTTAGRRGARWRTCPWRRSSDCPGWGIMLFAGGKRLSHTQPATDSNTQPSIPHSILPHILRMPRPWRRHSQTIRDHLTYSGRDMAGPSCITT